jgi:hypothetical protein
MSYKRRDPKFQDICSLAKMGAMVVFKTVEALLPEADNRRKMRIARRILTLCDGKDRRMKITEAQLEELVLPNVQCIDKGCPLLCFWEPMSRR